MSRRLRSYPLLAIVLVAVLLRLGLMARSSLVFDDPDNYLPVARSLAAGEGFTFRGRPTAYRPPLYPLLLVPSLALGRFASWGVASLHLLLGGGAVVLTAVAARGSGLSERRVWIAATIAACDPVLAWQSKSVMTETPAAFLVAAALAGLVQPGFRSATLGGVAYGLAALCRPSLLAGAGLTVLAALLAGPGGWRERVSRSVLLVLSIGVCLLPWMLRNLAILGEPIATTTHGGYTLALANNPVYYREVLNGPSGRVWTGDDQWRWWNSVNEETAGMTETQADRYLQDGVWRLARDNPRDFGRSIIARLGHFWGIVPASSVYPAAARLATLAWTLPLWLALGLGALRWSRWRWPSIA
ncbi:MAG: ArnT family glycosyltransferase, partial [Isosphaeraceae bacterium]